MSLPLDNVSCHEYTYGVSGWKDQLLSYDDKKCTYDAMGNPTTYKNHSLEWGRLRNLENYGDIASFTYNANGIRTGKIVGGKTTSYYLDGTRILAQDDGNKLIFNYGSEGLLGFTYDGVGEYYYKKNILGDILSILDSSGQEIVR